MDIYRGSDTAGFPMYQLHTCSLYSTVQEVLLSAIVTHYLLISSQDSKC